MISTNVWAQEITDPRPLTLLESQQLQSIADRNSTVLYLVFLAVFIYLLYGYLKKSKLNKNSRIVISILLSIIISQLILWITAPMILWQQIGPVMLPMSGTLLFYW